MTRRYRTLVDEFGKSRVLVVTKRIHKRTFEGYYARWTDRCSGCAEEYGADRGSGCRECGHTGKRRGEIFIPFDRAAFERALEERWQRRLGLVSFFAKRRVA